VQLLKTKGADCPSFLFQPPVGRGQCSSHPPRGAPRLRRIVAANSCGMDGWLLFSFNSGPCYELKSWDCPPFFFLHGSGVIGFFRALSKGSFFFPPSRRSQPASSFFPVCAQMVNKGGPDFPAVCASDHARFFFSHRLRPFEFRPGVPVVGDRPRSGRVKLFSRYNWPSPNTALSRFPGLVPRANILPMFHGP